jgi:hypothetical protein
MCQKNCLLKTFSSPLQRKLNNKYKRGKERIPFPGPSVLRLRARA